MPDNISVRYFFPHRHGLGFRWLFGGIDRLLGLHQLNRWYQQEGLAGLSTDSFLDTFIARFGTMVRLNGDLSAIPLSGAALVVANHPLGALEGVVLAWLLRQHRADVKILANQSLRVFPEIADSFIFTNPITPNAPGNLTSLRQCHTHLRQGGLLVVFPAGRVSYPPRVGEDIRDHPWDRMIAALRKHTALPVVPIYIAGRNRKRFYVLGLLHYRFRLLMLVREFLAKRQQPLALYPAAKPMTPFIESSLEMETDSYRLLTYLQDPRYRQAWSTETKKVSMQPIAPAQPPVVLHEEVAKLPPEHCVASYKQYRCYYAKQHHCPAIVEEIRRLREQCFRELDEGSGLPQDGDAFDSCYWHLFVFDTTHHRIIGAYRMGATDVLGAASDPTAMYLSRMFDFSPKFVNRTRPCLEMGRSFIIPSQQKSFHGLLLLFRGIAGFVRQHPQYQTLYGTVSLTKQYQPVSVQIINTLLTRPDPEVRAKHPFVHPLHPELTRFAEQYRDASQVLALTDYLVRQIEPDGKGIPVLLKQYYHLGARFYEIGIDAHFASTPGLLLQVEIQKIPEKSFKLFFVDAPSRVPIQTERLTSCQTLQQ